ncbi:MAG TPA: protein kinase [Gemmatimonadales bacterium]|nr:protein kinase [Gemmatimonadales bacterium]
MSDTLTRLAVALRDRYRLGAPLGAGGMATVYQAKDLRHDREVALKLLEPSVAAMLGTERFLREIRVTASLQHPHILGLFDSGSVPAADGEGSCLYYVMPLVDGGTLREQLERTGPPGVEETIRLVREVADALDHAHRRGIVHRDIKPENILLAEGHALVADFGIARAEQSTQDSRLTDVGLAMGTPAYMSPEQALGSATLDARSDQYSLACLCYELLTGEVPWQATSHQAMLARRLTQGPPTTHPGGVSFPDSLAAALQRALASDPDDRFPSTAAFAQALDAPAPLVAIPRAQQTIAVLDFQNLSASPGLEWLGSGIAETVTSDLRRVAGLTVLSRQATTQAMAGLTAPEGESIDPLALGRQLQARWVVTGAFQAAGGRIRITPQYFDVTAGSVALASKVDGAIEDIFPLQDQIVAELLDLLRIEVSAAEQRDIARPETDTLQAYEHYAKGQQLLNQFGDRDLTSAVAHFERAIAADPGYALAHAGLGAVWMFRYIAATDAADLERAIERLQHAAELDPGLVDPLRYLCYAYTRAGRFAEAIAAGERATILDPADAMAQYFLAVAQLLQDEALQRAISWPRAATHLLRALHVDPWVLTTHTVLAYMYLVRGQVEGLEALADRLAELEAGTRAHGPTFHGVALLIQAQLALRRGDHQHAQARVEELLAKVPHLKHVYVKALEGVARCALGETALRAREPDRAMVAFRDALHLAEQHSERLAMGFLFIRAHCGLARTFMALNTRREAERHLAIAEQTFREGRGWNFGWIGAVGLCQLYGHLDLAMAQLELDQNPGALAHLDDAVAQGWGDVEGLMTATRSAGVPILPEFAVLQQRIAGRPMLPPLPSIPPSGV